MRISTATTLVCSTLATVALYQGFAALFPHLAHPDDESASNAKKDGTKADQTKEQAKSAIASPETLSAAMGGTGTTVPNAGQLVASANRPTVSIRKLPTVNVPPTMRSMPNRLSDAPSVSSDSMQNTPGMGLPETMDQSKPDLIEQSRANVSTTQSLPVTSVETPLSDVKGHWAESFIESLAAKGVARGFRDGSFRPDELVTSQQFTLMTQKAFTASPVSYSDLQRLHPDRAPTRADAAAFIYQMLAKGESAPLTMAVQVSGAVPRPGIYAIANGRRIDSPANAGVPTVSRAIQQAGGALEGANLHQVQIHRIGETSARQVINVDVRQLLTGDRSRDIVLQQGDKLFIPTAAKTASNPATTSPATTSPATNSPATRSPVPSSRVTSALPTPEHSASLVESTK